MLARGEGRSKSMKCYIRGKSGYVPEVSYSSHGAHWVFLALPKNNLGDFGFSVLLAKRIIPHTPILALDELRRVRLPTMFHRRGRVEGNVRGLYAGCGISVVSGSNCKWGDRLASMLTQRKDIALFIRMYAMSLGLMGSEKVKEVNGKLARIPQF